MASTDDNNPTWQYVAMRFIGWLTLMTPIMFTTIQSCEHGQKLEKQEVNQEKLIKVQHENSEKLGTLQKTVETLP